MWNAWNCSRIEVQVRALLFGGVVAILGVHVALVGAPEVTALPKEKTINSRVLPEGASDFQTVYRFSILAVWKGLLTTSSSSHSQIHEVQKITLQAKMNDNKEALEFDHEITEIERDPPAVYYVPETQILKTHYLNSYVLSQQNMIAAQIFNTQDLCL